MGAKKMIHHANLLVAPPEEAEDHLRLVCDDLGVTLGHNPNFFVFKKKVFGIDEARELRLLASRKAFSSKLTPDAPESSPAKVFFIVAEQLTLEAQNALLKTFEDPTPQTYFFLAVREESLIIPTLSSRMQTAFVSRDSAGSLANTEAEKFLSLSIKDRLSFAKRFADEERSLPVFLDGLLWVLRKRGESDFVKNVYRVRHSLPETSLAPRLVIEHLALVL